jgi:hypothetical protein
MTPEDAVDSVFKLVISTSEIRGKEPDLFMCNRAVSDALKAFAAKSGSPVTMKYENHMQRMYVFGIPFYLTEDFVLEPFTISNKPDVPTEFTRC